MGADADKHIWIEGDGMALLYVIYDDDDQVRLVSRDWNAVRAMLEDLARRDGAPRLEIYGRQDGYNSFGRQGDKKEP